MHSANALMAVGRHCQLCTQRPDVLLREQHSSNGAGRKAETRINRATDWRWFCTRVIHVAPLSQSRCSSFARAASETATQTYNVVSQSVGLSAVITPLLVMKVYCTCVATASSRSARHSPSDCIGKYIRGLALLTCSEEWSVCDDMTTQQPKYTQ